MLHYIIVIIIICVIIYFQFYSFRDTKNKIQKYLKIFPKSKSDYAINQQLVELSPVSDNDDDDVLPIEDDSNLVEVSQVDVKSDSNTMKEIVQSLNMYLQKNKGAASDFHLMKDVVERYCDADAEEISTQQSIPLYLGLMGTMVGIIIGIGAVAFSGGIGGTALMKHITELMTCVAIAMAASLIGVYCTTRIAWLSKSAVSEVEAEKNEFYSWLQTELLPALSGNTTNALYLLQQNLSTFNLTFKKNVDDLNNALGKVSDSSREQIELVELLKDIDINRVAKANIQVLRELKDCTGEISVFNTYLHNVSGYLEAVNALNSNINEHLNRTAAIERMGAFFEREINQVSTREQYINQVVANVDDTLKNTFNALSESTRQGVSTLKNSSATEFDALKDTLTEEKQAFKDSLLNSRNEFADYVKEQKTILGQRAQEIDTLAQEIHAFAQTQSSIGDLLAASKKQNQKLDELISVLKSERDSVAPAPLPSSTNGGYSNSGQLTLPKWMKIGSYAIMAMIAILFILRVIEFIGDHSGSPEIQPTPSAQEIVVPAATPDSTITDSTIVVGKQ